MKIGIIGSSGYLGSYLAHALSRKHEVRRFSPLDSDIESKSAYLHYIIDCSWNTKDLHNINTQERCYDSKITLYSKLQCKLITFSSYYVNQKIQGTEKESCFKTSLSYAFYKKNIEQYLTGRNAITFRLGKLFGNPLNSTRDNLFNFIINNEKIQTNNIVFPPCSVFQVERAINKELEERNLCGVYNLSNSVFQVERSINKELEEGYCCVYNLSNHGGLNSFNFSKGVVEVLGLNKEILEPKPVDTFNDTSFNLNRIEQVGVEVVDYKKDLVLFKEYKDLLEKI